MCFLLKYEYWSAIKSKDTMNFIGKWIQLGIIIQAEITQTQKDKLVCIHLQVMLTIKYRISTLLSIDQKKLNKKEDPHEHG